MFLVGFSILFLQDTHPHSALHVVPYVNLAVTQGEGAGAQLGMRLIAWMVASYVSQEVYRSRQVCVCACVAKFGSLGLRREANNKQNTVVPRDKAQQCDCPTNHRVSPVSRDTAVVFLVPPVPSVALSPLFLRARVRRDVQPMFSQTKFSRSANFLGSGADWFSMSPTSSPPPHCCFAVFLEDRVFCACRPLSSFLVMSACLFACIG